jgi:two-component system cell cycle response regulator DivK
MAKILLVEDSDALRDMVARRLQRRGFEVLAAADGAEAVALAQAERPDLVLLDLRLPVMDGWQVARVLRSTVATADIPIIALTAHALADERASALAAGCDEYETKPIDFDRLVAKLERLLPIGHG